MRIGTERFNVAALVAPVVGATPITSGYVDAATAGSTLVALVLVGNVAGTVDAKLVQATSDAGAGVKDISGKAITQVGASGDSKGKLINLDVSALDWANGFRYVALVITPSNAADAIAGAILVFDPTYGPGSDVASIDQIVA